MTKIPEFPNETNSNPVVAIDLYTQAGTILRLKIKPAVQQARVMMALGRLLADLGVPPPLDFDLPLPMGVSGAAILVGVVPLMRDVCMGVLQAHLESNGLDILDERIRAQEDNLVRIAALLALRG